MSGFPFSEKIGSQVDALAENLELLRAFAGKHPDIKPWLVSALNASVMFSSSQSDFCRRAFGADDWQVDGGYAYKNIEGIRVELRLPQATTSPLVTI